MASSVLKNMAAGILRDVGRGQHVPSRLVIACRRTIQGTGTAQDAADIRAYFKVRRSGASGLKKQQSKINDLFNMVNAANLATSEDSFTAGVAQAQILNRGIGAMQKAVKGPLKPLITGILEQLGKDPRTQRIILNSMAAGLRLGGAIGGAAIFGAQIGMHFADQAAKSIAAQGSLADINREAKTNTALLQAASNRTRQIMGRAGFGPEFLFGGDYDQATVERQKQFIQTLEKGRRNADALGIDEGDAYAEKASALGISVNQLNERERREALDEAVARNLRDVTDSKEAYEYADSEIARQTNGEKLLDAFGSNERLAAKKRQLREDFAKRSQASKVQLKEDAKEIAEQFRNNMTEAERLEEQATLLEADVRLAGLRSQHRIVNYD